jgi:alpha-maltose-1-phosphate synthase
LHIGFLTLEYPPLISGGIGTSIRNLARALVRLGHQVTVLGWGKDAAFEDQGVRVRFIGHTRLPGLGWLIHRRRIQQEINRLVKEENLAIVEAHDWCGPSALLKVRCPLVIRCNGSATYFGQMLNERVRRSILLAERNALRGADAVAAVSRFTADLTAQLFNLPAAVKVIHNGIDIRQFQSAGLHEQPDTLLYFGTLIRKKGVLDLGPIFNALVERYPQARLLLVGRDAADPQTGSRSTWELLSRSFSPKAAERVNYLGSQPFDKMQEYIQQAAVCLFPSYAEALPLTWLEAMACQKAIVAYDIGWAAEIVDSGVNGILVKPGEVESIAVQLRELLSNAPLRQRLGVAARQKVEASFSDEVIAQQTLAWYQQVLQKDFATEAQR